jgi:hypothetical protein
MGRQPPVGRLDNIIRDLERLHNDAQDIFDSHIDVIRCRCPDIPFDVVKSCKLTAPAGSALNYIAALNIVRDAITGQKEKT